jgi:HAD superfamily hydrolase (TIGR01509 family)
MKQSIQKHKIKAISFDLDDTLYLNAGVIAQAEAALLTWLAQYVDAQALAAVDWVSMTTQAQQQEPTLVHDVSQCREYTIALVLEALGLPAASVRTVSQDAMRYFVVARSQVEIAPEVIQILTDLRASFPLAVITNGNLDLKVAGIDGLFETVYKADLAHPKKPAIQMFDCVCQDLRIAPEALLHVGDNWNTDVLGAYAAGCQVAWLSALPLPDDQAPYVWQIPTLSALTTLLCPT